MFLFLLHVQRYRPHVAAERDVAPLLDFDL